MPPRKRLKTSSQGASTPSQSDHPDPPSATQEATHHSEAEGDAIITDPWTDDQETSLLKGIIRWKPVGMHKHFRMLAISDYMKSQGYAPAADQHTRIPGIWDKLGGFYNLSGLDDREEPLATEGSEDADSSKELYCPFELPDEEYGDMMFDRRLNPEGSTSPSISGRGLSRRPSTVAETDEARSSPAPSRPGRRGARSTRKTRGSTRSSRLQAERESTKGRNSGSPVHEDDTQEDGDEEEADGHGAEAAAGDADGDSKSVESPAPRTTRTQASRARGKKGKLTTKRGSRKR